MPETWPGLPMPALPTVTLPGLAFSQAISSLRLFGGSVLPADDHGRLGRDQPNRLEVLQQIDRQVVDRAAGHIGAPLADLHVIAVGRRARDADRRRSCRPRRRCSRRSPVWPRCGRMPSAMMRADRVGRAAGGERNHDR